MPSVGVDDYLVRGVRLDSSGYSRKVSCYKYKYTYNIDIYKRLTIYFQQFMGFRVALDLMYSKDNPETYLKQFCLYYL